MTVRYYSSIVCSKCVEENQIVVGLVMQIPSRFDFRKNHNFDLDFKNYYSTKNYNNIQCFTQKNVRNLDFKKVKWCSDVYCFNVVSTDFSYECF